MRIRTAREGAALVLALLLLVIMECVIVGVLQVSRQQHRIAAAAVTLLELRLAAENTLRRSLHQWPAESIGAGVSGTLRIATRESDLDVHVLFELLSPELTLVTAAAATPAPLRARYAASVLVHPPLLQRPDLLAAAASAVSVEVGDEGMLSAGPPDGCAHPTQLAVRTRDLLAPARAVSGPVAFDFDPDAGPLRDFTGDIPGTLRLSTDSIIHDFTGVLVSGAAVTVAAGGSVRGIVIARAARIDAGALVSGAVYVSGHLEVRGTVHGDPCAIRAAVRRALVDQARPVPQRHWIPAF